MKVSPLHFHTSLTSRPAQTSRQTERILLCSNVSAFYPISSDRAGSDTRLKNFSVPITEHNSNLASPSTKCSVNCI
jgi:hypothetical protein